MEYEVTEEISFERFAFATAHFEAKRSEHSPHVWPLIGYLALETEGQITTFNATGWDDLTPLLLSFP